jgi:hypothetical protein
MVHKSLKPLEAVKTFVTKSKKLMLDKKFRLAIILDITKTHLVQP